MCRLNVEVRLRRDGEARWVIGSIDRVHLANVMALSSRLAWTEGYLCLSVEDVPELERELDRLNQRLHALGVWRSWRGERLALWADDWSRMLGTIERSAARFWGIWTLGAHCNGYVCDEPGGRPQALWIARRSAFRPVDPGLLDNLVGCGVRVTETPEAALRREAWEEAGLPPERLCGMRLASIQDTVRLTEGGGLHRQRVHIFDIETVQQLSPVNQDGEVDCFSLMPIRTVIEALNRNEFAADAAFVTRDFLARHEPAGARHQDASTASPLAGGGVKPPLDND